MLKKFFIFAIALMLVLSGCTSEETVTENGVTENTVTEYVGWERDLDEHWITDENGEKTKLAAHEFDESGVCAVCNSEIIDSGSGSIDICSYLDEERDYISSMTSYENGEIVHHFECKYEFDENGRPTYAAAYEDGRLIEEQLYSENTSIYYEADGTYYKQVRDEGLTWSESYHFDAEGNPTEERYYKLNVNSNGDSLLKKQVSFDYENNAKYVFEYDENCSGYVVLHETYDLEDNLITYMSYEYEYDEKLRATYQRSFLEGELVNEIYYTIIDEADGAWRSQPYKEVFYDFDGSYSVVEYDELGNLISEDLYDSNGNKVG